MACPGGSPSQTITVVNQANVRPATLTRVERAVSAQSLQVHAAWGTPCARFAPGGWKLYLKIGGPEPRGEHDYDGRRTRSYGRAAAASRAGRAMSRTK